MTPLCLFVASGVLERHPKLKFVLVECYISWLAWVLQTLDQINDNRHVWFQPYLMLKPSEYFRRNVFLGASCMPRREAEMRHEIGIENLIWGSDYPHPEGTWPFTKKQMIETFHDIPEDEAAKMLGGNAASLFGFDTEKLGEIAARIGPLKTDFITENAGR